MNDWLGYIDVYILDEWLAIHRDQAGMRANVDLVYILDEWLTGQSISLLHRPHKIKAYSAVHINSFSDKYKDDRT